MLARLVRLVLVLGLLIGGCLVVGNTRAAAEDLLPLNPQFFSLTAAVPPASSDTAFGLVPRDTYGSWRYALVSGAEDTADVAEALFQYRAVRAKVDVPLCPWGQYWASAERRCVTLEPTTSAYATP